MNTPLKADHPERPTITPGWSLEHPLGILTNIVFLDFLVSRSGWHRTRGVPICSQLSARRRTEAEGGTDLVEALTAQGELSPEIVEAPWRGGSRPRRPGLREAF